MPTRTVITRATSGVDMRKNPLLMGTDFVASAVNISFDEGGARTRPGFIYNSMKARGKFGGATRFQPARGLSFRPFAPSVDAIAIAVNGDILLYEYGGCANQICNPVHYTSEVNLFQAENYLVVQARDQDTTWYEGGHCFVRSPGIAAREEAVKETIVEVEAKEKELFGQQRECCYERIRYTEFKASPVEGEEDLGSHDTFIWDKHRNFLINGAGLGIYAHGRIHQEGPYSIYVSDIIHGRGNKATDDILLMEEQMLASMGPTLSTNSSMGNLVAMEVMPKQGSANGEGDLVAYYEHGVVSFDTFQFPRETRHDGEGNLIQEGWDTKRMVSSLLNSITAVGRYAVTVLPRDHFFRSKFGLHFLKTSLGEGTFNDETTNVISSPISPLLEADPERSLSGSATGHWVKGNRMFATTGMQESKHYSVDSFGHGFVSWNQAITFTQDRTPMPKWEGLWLPDNGISGIFKFSDIRDRYGFICSSTSSEMMFAEIADGAENDIRDGEEIPIEWEIVTASIAPSGLSRVSSIKDGRIEIMLAKGSQAIVECRTDRDPEWAAWSYVDGDDKGRTLVSQSFGMPPQGMRDATWIQFRITGIGYAEILELAVDASEGVKKAGRNSCNAIPATSADHFRLKTQPSFTRWQK